MNTMTATYSPDDNKLRLYAMSRLDADTYARVKEAGFKWAPKQGFFVAPMWTPDREDLLMELCGDIGDDDKGLMDRAEDRSDRFEDYSDARRSESAAASAESRRLTDMIPFGQPILVGHHSEKMARRHAERIWDTLGKSVKLWRTAEYWKGRAAASIRHAKYKERPDVRARRIKGIEADKRRCERIVAESETCVRIWSTVHDDSQTIVKRKDGEPNTFADRVRHLVGHTQYGGGMGLYHGLKDGTISPEEAQRRVLESNRKSIVNANRWIEHCDLRLEYERAMLAADGGTVADRTGPEVGGACKCWASHSGCWSYIRKVNKVSVTVEDNWGNGGGNFTRTIPFDKLNAIMTKAEVDAARADGRLVETKDKTGFALAAKGQP